MNPFDIFGRPRASQPQMMDDDFDDDFDDDYDPRGGMGELGDDELPEPDDSFDVEHTIEGQFDDSDLDGDNLEEEVEGEFEEDGDEEMQDRGTTQHNFYS
jgi:anaphase-promoting complex subunit 10